ncbi:Alpha-tubulin suppressor [Sandaracinus amylolyticus]|uniref:Alpha-tubulin suppressor n=2 Tax=Sandaracinus amylolyticus TaxID=927083 RepID=A0A0F6YNX7_9BACT|nr:Alpha-tubulin suppressor [Sandaracinus amylolyticus]
MSGCARGGADGRDARPAQSLDAGPAIDAANDAGMGDDAAPAPIDAATIDPDDAGDLDASSSIADASTSDAGTVDRCASVDCAGLDGPCVVGVCDPLSGACRAQPRASGTGCDDGDRCTTGDACSAGTCAGTALDCTSMDGLCARGTCNAATGACVATPVADGTSCDPDATDCVTQTCRAGTCGAVVASDCTACGGGVCAAGTCGAAPSALHYGFEAGLPSGWTVGGAGGWVIDGSRVLSGAMAAHSGATGNGATSSMRASFTVRERSLVTFRLSTSSERSYDWLEVAVDGVDQWGWSGETAWMQAAVVIPAGTHVVEWRYAKDSSGAQGSDRVWIDDVRVEHLQPSADFESGVMPSAFTTSSTTGWVVDGSSVHAGAFAARSAAIGNDGASTLSRLVSLGAAGELSFWVRTSTERDYDVLELFVDGTARGEWSGETAWTRVSVALSAGEHLIEWRYSKDGSDVAGMDRVWIDDVATGEAAGSGAICGP